MSRKPAKQPRSISQDLALVPSYRASLHAELQKFGSSKRDYQLSLWEKVEHSETISTSGLDLSISEDKALSAIQILLDKTNYQGSEPGEETHSHAFKWSGKLPKLFITYSQYFEAYGITRKGDGSYYSHQADEALEALKSLATTPRAIYYERKHWQGGRQLSDIIKAKAPLLKLTEVAVYKDLEQDEAERVKAGQEVPARARGLLIEVSPLLVDGIASFYLLKPATLHKEIQQQLGSRRISRTPSLFIEWLLTKNKATVKATKKLLIERLRLSGYIERRHREIAEARLQEAFQVAKDLCYLKDYKEKPPGSGSMIFILNPERCHRVKTRRRKDERTRR